MMGLASFLISIPAIRFLWISFSSNTPWSDKEKEMNKAAPLSPSLPPSLSLPPSFSPCVSPSFLSHLSILEDKEAHIFSMMDFVFSEYWRCIVLDPHSCQLIAMDVIMVKSTLQVNVNVNNINKIQSSKMVHIINFYIAIKFKGDT